MADVKKNLPEGASFEMNHVDFLRAASPKVQGLLSKAIVVAKKMDMEKKMVGAIFNYLQVKRGVITSEQDIRKIFVVNGADGEKFDKLMSSFSINSQAKVMKKNQNYFSSKRGADGKPYLNSVPTVIVNGKYKINPSALSKGDFIADYNKLVNDLLTLK
jgi:thiol:disulfide interchange protein DsbA